MRFIWEITDSDIARLRSFVNEQSKNGLVIHRARNCSPRKESVTKDSFWREMVCMRLTSQQKSGPDSHVAKFGDLNPFPLSYSLILAAGDPAKLITQALSAHGGIRHGTTIGDQLANNFFLLEEGEWPRTLAECNRLTKNVDRSVEASVADYINTSFKGFGPKQSRNLLQSLGLTRFEIPIDSRVIAWFNNFGFPFILSSGALSDIHYYKLVQNGIQELCQRCDVLPCILDASIFSLKDGDGWTHKLNPTI